MYKISRREAKITIIWKQSNVNKREKQKFK